MQQMGWATLIVGAIGLYVFGNIISALSKVGDFWNHTLFPFFNSFLWAAIVIGLALWIGYVLYKREMNPDKKEVSQEGDSNSK